MSKWAKAATLTTFTDRRCGADRPTIGPNAIIQLIAAARALGLEREVRSIFTLAGEGAWLLTPPAAMVDEQRVIRVHHAVHAVLTPFEASRLLTDAGVRTADYLLANRIPRPVQAMFRIMPRPVGGKVLSAAIRSHAWTFAGSGRFRVIPGPSVTFEIAGNPFCDGYQSIGPACVWHLAVFERLFMALISPDIRAGETACVAAGDPCCRFELPYRVRRYEDRIKSTSAVT
jgi:divinyl protochlorophyllide a 8-vinyl-reductase